MNARQIFPAGVSFNSGVKMMIPVLFENDDVLAVDKPEGLTSIPGSEKGNDTLLGLLSNVYTQKLFVVHRLDKDVSGVMLFAKNAAAHKCLNDRFCSRKVKKTYAALVHGAIETSGGSIDKPIRQFGSGRMGIDELRGKPSSTGFEVVDRFGKFTLVKAFPGTGRKHQIRVHFYSIGHPIAGDTRYGEKVDLTLFPRMMLHALSITFALPSGEEKTIDSTLPESFEAVLAAIRLKEPSGNPC
jgi:tRNA pseudouridine32 synthase / 23S rRNA pseudouridine746 synthase